jgi:hypothetical protein
MNKQQEISRFTSSGKTFFFNKGKARNGTDYLAINAIYGQGNRERTVLFPPHYMEYVKHVTEAVEKLTGFSKSTPNSGCPKCGEDRSNTRAAETPDHEYWVIVCRVCGTLVEENKEDAISEVAQHMGWDIK